MTLASPPTSSSFFQRVERFCCPLGPRQLLAPGIQLRLLPAASKSGISMRWTDDGELRPRMPYRRVNKNWYGAMAGPPWPGMPKSLAD